MDLAVYGSKRAFWRPILLHSDASPELERGRASKVKLVAEVAELKISLVSEWWLPKGKARRSRLDAAF